MIDFGQRKLLLELQRRQGGVLTRDQVEQIAKVRPDRFDRAIDSLVEAGLLVVNRRGGQDLVSLTLAGRSCREEP